MDYHLKCLGKLCRLCGNKIVTGRGYVNAKTMENYKNLLMGKLRIKTDENKEVNRCQVSSNNYFC